jgi:glycosyltransferase involved in cell wall biosynthesis
MMVSRPPNMAFVETLWSKRPALFKGMRLIYDAEAIFALRDIGQAAVRGQPMSIEKARQLVDDELTLIRRADTVLSVSANEAEMFRAAGAADVRLLSHAMETRSNPPSWDSRSGLLFVGAIHPNTPNEDSLLWFYEHVTPILRGLCANLSTISIVGDCTSDKVAQLAGEHVRLIGRVDDLTPWYDSHRVFIAPTRFAAGVPAKVIEAACNGIPVVATPLLVRQLGWQDGLEIASGDTAEAIAEAVVALYDNPQIWSRQCHAMATRTRALYAPQVFAATLESVIQSLGN